MPRQFDSSDSLGFWLVTNCSLQKTAHQSTLLASKGDHAIISLDSWLWLRGAGESATLAIVLNEKIAEAQNA
jgi:hypothetical protein